MPIPDHRQEPIMHSTSRCILAGALALQALAAQAAGRIELAWIEPERFIDSGPTAADRAETLHALGGHIQQLAGALPDGQTLKIEVTDLNLAGEVRFMPGRDVRVLRNRADWPTMNLRYTLVADGRVLKSGETRLSDMNYGFTLRSDAYGYEKRMIDTWFRAEFGAGR
jgi:Protein of unknown function (DUF3016)